MTAETELREAVGVIADRIDQRLAEIGKTARSVSIEATGSPDAIRYIRARNAMPSAARLAAIAKVLGVPSSALLGSPAPEDSEGPIEPALSELDRLRAENEAMRVGLTEIRMRAAVQRLFDPEPRVDEALAGIIRTANGALAKLEQG